MENEIIKRIQDYALEEIMGDRFGKYAKEIILDRAIPDVRDGLKPVQRRILYAMYKAGNTYDKGYIKCAATVGDVLGKFHPHGDSSVYDAMVRMSQWWKQNSILIDIHGNNGSMDGDQAAAYRYTEARLAKISMQLLQDLDKDTVKWAPNFDDRFLEPTVLPAAFPNLLVNGANGISAGYATNIPPHNLGEVIDATIKRIDSPTCRLDTLLEIVKGPDFPTGAIVEGKNGIIDAFTTGRGKVIVRSKTRFEKNKGKEQIIIDEIPFDVNKAVLVAKIDSLRIDKKIDGMAEVRDETDREGLRIVIDLKAGANKDFILNYLFKNTDLQMAYNYNMVAIVKRTPRTLGLIEVLDAYIEHYKDVVTKRTKFNLDTYQKEFNIVSGLIKAISILDSVIKTIRNSKNKSDAKNNLVEKYDFTVEQAEAIVTLQLYKLTNTDVVALEKRAKELEKLISECKNILEDENVLKNLMKIELKNVKKEYATERKTVIKDEVSEITIDELDLVSKDDYIVCLSKKGYIKKVPLKSYSLSESDGPGLRDSDSLESIYKVNNLDTIIIFTNLGNYLYLPVRNINEFKYKDIGDYIGTLVSVSDGEKVVRSIAVNKLDNSYITIFTKNGMVKRVLLKDLEVQRYNKALTCIKLKDEDRVVSVSKNNDEETVSVSKNGFVIRFKTDEIPFLGTKASGVKLMNLKEDEVSGAFVISPLKEYITIFTDKNTSKRVKLSDISVTSRAKKGVLLLKSPKSKAYSIIYAFNSGSKTVYYAVSDVLGEIKNSEIVISDIKSVGSTFTKRSIFDIYEKPLLKDLTVKNSLSEVRVEKQEVIVKKIVEKTSIKKQDNNVKKEVSKGENLTMSDFFDEFKL